MKERVVTWGRVRLGEGMPKIAVPLMGRSVQEMAFAAERAVLAQADVLELRMDSLSAMPDIGTALRTCAAVREKAGGAPVLFTLRTARDQGAGSSDAAAYEALLCDVARAGACEAIDCELSVGKDAFSRITENAHACGVSVVGSSHAFDGLADLRVAQEWLLRQRALGADVCKAAVMARDVSEALRISAALCETAQSLDAPVIAIAMGQAGLLSRIGAECMGSCLTFGTAGQSSAPGQIDAFTLRGLLCDIHKAVHRS